METYRGCAIIVAHRYGAPPRRRGQRRVLHTARALRQPQRAAIGMAHPHPRENQTRHGRGPIGGSTALQLQSRVLTKPGFNFSLTRRPLSDGYS